MVGYLHVFEISSKMMLSTVCHCKVGCDLFCVYYCYLIQVAPQQAKHNYCTFQRTQAALPLCSDLVKRNI